MGLRRTEQPSARTSEEREQARLERERRRLAREGKQASAPAEIPAEPTGRTAVEVPPPPQEPEPELPPEPEPHVPTEPAPEPQLPEEPAEPEVPAEPAPAEPAPQPPAPELPEQPADEFPAKPAAAEREPEPLAPEPPTEEHQAPPPPAGLRPLPGAPRRHLHRPHVPHPHLHRPHLPRRTGRKQHSLTQRLGAGAALLAVLAAVGAGALELERHIRHKPIKPLAVVKVVIPEGYTRAQMAQLAHEDGLRGDYSEAVAQSKLLSPQSYGAPSKKRSLEGFLFPSSYQLYAGASATKLVELQLSTFTENFGHDQELRARALGVSPYELLTVASMVEREAALDRERPLVAAVIYNRLRLHMPLGIDATLRYALHDYTHQLTEAQLHSASAYNTRTHTGLPPTPISNPGKAAIEAAAHPAHVSYLYYVARADGCQGQVFSTSYREFERNAAAYREALRRNHGRVPSCSKH